jgi:hypothetical protein
MSKYTTQVRFICETAAGLSESEGQTSVKQIIATAIPSVFDFDFPIFDESYRTVLETKILKHYYTREIGLETAGLWKLKLDTKLNEIMPFYNQLYKSELIEFNPMYDVDLTRDHTLNRSEQTEQTGTETADATKNGTVDTTTSGTKTGTSRENIDVSENQETEQNSKSDTDIKNTTGVTSEETATGTKTHYDKYSDTPQGSLQNVQNDTYLTNARMVNDNDTQTGKTTVSGSDTSTGSTTADTSTTTNSTSETTHTGNTTDETSGTQNTTSADTVKRNTTQTANKELTSLDDYLEHVKGKNGGVSYSAMLNEFRTTFLNIDMQVINELSDLFMNLW